ncbi:MAG: hypothetical protein FJ011_23810 [Chloroflexi bacterium]|nr:hypothetical protein [Chloroflexota bacterium]
MMQRVLVSLVMLVGLAELGGVAGYPYRKLGDSISWSGRLRGNAYLDMTTRVVVYADDFIQVAGLAVIGLTE